MDRPASPGLTISIPAFNEAPNISAALDEAVATARRFPGSAEVLVVDDRSTDGTGELADRFAARGADVTVRVVHHSANRGFSGAIRACLEGARGELVLLMPADGQVRTDVLFDFLAAVPDADVVVGVRARPARTRGTARRSHSCSTRSPARRSASLSASSRRDSSSAGPCSEIWSFPRAREGKPFFLSSSRVPFAAGLASVRS